MSLRRAVLSAVAATVAAGAFAVSGALGGGGAPGVVQGSKGLTARSGAVRYVTFAQDGRTIVAAVLTRGGNVARFRWIRGSYGIPLVALDGSAEGLTRDGRTLVLAPATVAPLAAESRFALVDTRTLRVRRILTLKGAFAYDALSPDGKTLYLIELLGQSGDYRVRAYDLAQSRLYRQSVVDKSEADELMVGTPLTRATSADGGWVYTLYTRPDKPPFVHALDARHRRAVCIDLPWQGSQDPLFQMRLKLNASGTKLVLGTRSGKAAVVIDTRTHRARRG
jgi:hypothetical protein